MAASVLIRLPIVTDQLQAKFRKLAAMMIDTEHEVLTFLNFPKEHRVKIHSTNVLERLNGEIKCRANVVGTFPNEGAVRRLVGTLLADQLLASSPEAIVSSLDSSERPGQVKQPWAAENLS